MNNVHCFFLLLLLATVLRVCKITQLIVLFAETSVTAVRCRGRGCGCGCGYGWSWVVSWVWFVVSMAPLWVVAWPEMQKI